MKIGSVIAIRGLVRCVFAARRALAEVAAFAAMIGVAMLVT